MTLLRYLLAFITISWSCITLAAEKLMLQMPNFPPYTYKYQDEFRGIGYQQVKKVLQLADLDYQLQVVSDYGRAVHGVKHKLSDGFFLASQNKERDELAVFTSPIMTNRWCWFTLADSELSPSDVDFKRKARVGTFINTNTNKWLTENGYNVSGTPSQIHLLILMLQKKRIDAVLLAEHVFYESVEKAGFSRDYFKMQVEVEKPFGMYISKNYLADNPEVLDKINDAIYRAQVD